ncbi:hypothetical protein EUGRSUZ_L02009 [Eucalyptus grandis]|uniref:Uncharacterized protein n=1 Tax=Eucalyptus grandis TaxID=71139 RepID=A0A058ZT03_EUCGR|nr:hypothetical protein EUGRSUZ_L02009 [Eucalyptus grandis]
MNEVGNSRTHSKGDNSGGKGEEPVLCHLLGDPDEGISNSKHDPPQQGAHQHSRSPHEDQVIAPQERLHLQPNGLPIFAKRRKNRHCRLLENLLGENPVPRALEREMPDPIAFQSRRTESRR